MFLASILTKPALDTLLLTIPALVLLRIVLTAPAPAPLMAMPAEPPMPTAREAAAAIASMVWAEVAVMLIAPDVALKELSAFLTVASTSLEIRLSARETPMDRETPAEPPPAIPSDAAPASALMVEVSRAVRDALVALIPVAPSPSMNALTRVATLLVVSTPEPLAAIPALPPTAIAAEPAPTPALIVALLIALRVNAPLAARLEFWI